jgi:hypothetical protein
VFLPPMWLALIPVVLVEAAVNCRLLAVPFRRAIVPAAIGNVVSTIAGIPLMWALLATIEFVCCGDAKGLSTAGSKIYAVTAQAPWLIPYESELHWMLPAALAVFAVPCLAISVLVEAPINARALRPLPHRRVWRVTAISNVASYLFLALLCWIELRTPRTLDMGVLQSIADWWAELVFRIAALPASH